MKERAVSLWSCSDRFLLCLTAKGYSSPAEEALRKEIWLANREVVLVHNILADQGMKSYRMDMTEFADMVRGEGRCFFSSAVARVVTVFFRFVETRLR